MLERMDKSIKIVAEHTRAFTLTYDIFVKEMCRVGQTGEMKEKLWERVVSSADENGEIQSIHGYDGMYGGIPSDAWEAIIDAMKFSCLRCDCVACDYDMCVHCVCETPLHACDE